MQSTESAQRTSKSNSSNFFLIIIYKQFGFLLGKSKYEESSDTKKRFVDLFEKKWEAKSKATAEAPAIDGIDVQIKGFSMLLGSSRKQLPNAKRWQKLLKKTRKIKIKY